MTIAEKVNEVINEFVTHYGTNTTKSADEIQSLVATRYEIKKQSFQITDYCYNRYSIRLDDFGVKNRLFEQLPEGKYRLLGSKYKYNGYAYHKPKTDGYEYIVGEWNNGVFSFYKSKDQVSKREYRNMLIEEAKKVDEHVSRMDIVGAEKDAVVKVRVNQNFFRERLVKRYNKCCLCGVSSEALMSASHIKPWASCSDDEKLDVDNGLLLCPNHDKLFDGGWISFSDDGKIIISDDLNTNDRIFMNINENMQIDLTEENKKYMSYHRDNLFRI